MTLLDTGPLVALLDRREQYHDWTVEKLRATDGVLWTCGAVISEACFLLGSHPRAVERLHDWLGHGDIRFAGEDASLWGSATELMRRYANVPMSFADACLVALAEQYTDARIFTLDGDFQIYRSAAGERLPLIAPFA